MQTKDTNKKSLTGNCIDYGKSLPSEKDNSSKETMVRMDDVYTNYLQVADNDWNEYHYPKTYGWICPKCGMVNAPHCDTCGCSNWPNSPSYYPPVPPWVYTEPITWYSTNDDGTVSGEFH